MSDPAVEALSAELHAIYQREARRQAGTGEDSVRHPDDYDALPEHTKEYDRVLARFILARDSEQLRTIEKLQRTIVKLDQRLGAALAAGAADAHELTAPIRRLRAILANPNADAPHTPACSDGSAVACLCQEDSRDPDDVLRELREMVAGV